MDNFSDKHDHNAALTADDSTVDDNQSRPPLVRTWPFWLMQGDIEKGLASEAPEDGSSWRFMKRLLFWIVVVVACLMSIFYATHS